MGSRDSGFEQATGGQIQFRIHLGGSYKTVNSAVNVTAGQYIMLLVLLTTKAINFPLYKKTGFIPIFRLQ
ncbi:hypothetical protein EZS27_028338 [termite gut metagenome]|uniref:Uncharacterized protein n=1 Tax=termite gut metagenome TaxID=433724 RepID=A0A5J4QM78_9ZZZZ